MFSWLRRFLFGEPLPTRRMRHERLPKWMALPVLASDVLSSSAYATEEMVLVLWAGGAAALQLSLPVTFAILALLAIVTISYRQTVYAYPEGGGAFSVARENLGEPFGLTAAAALLIGYVLTVSVSIAAASAAVTSYKPQLLSPYRVPLCLLFITLMAIANLRGARESGKLFAPPTYGFIFSIVVLVAVGLWKYFAEGRPPAPDPVDYPGQTKTLSAFLVLTAFARGCAALTGTEAISNGVQAFRPPESRNAAITLVWMSTTLGALFLGITYLAHIYGVTPEVHYDPQTKQIHVDQTLVSRIARTVLGEGILYFIVQGATMLILVLAANTAYVDFPRLSSILARAGFAPRQLANLGDRLVYSWGIILLSLISAFLIIIFRGETHALIPLYAIGVFISFTLSQAGMVARWFRLKGSRWKLNALINGIGATTTAIVFIVQLTVNFMDGAWMIGVAIVTLIWWMRKTHNHYINLAEQLSMDGYKPTGPLRHRVIVLVPSLHRGIMHALNYARTLSNNLEAVYVNIDPQAPAHHRRVLKLFGRRHEPHLESLTPAVEQLRQKWDKWASDIHLTILDSEYRSLIQPVLDYLDEIIDRDKLDLVTVVIPEFAPAKWWHHLLHNQSGLMLKLALLNKPKVVVVNVRYALKE